MNTSNFIPSWLNLYDILYGRANANAAIFAFNWKVNINLRTAFFIICFPWIVCLKRSCCWNAIQKFYFFKIASFLLVEWHYSLCYIQLESVATSYNLMTCSIGTLIGSKCGTTSSKLNITQETVPISLCDWYQHRIWPNTDKGRCIWVWWGVYIKNNSVPKVPLSAWWRMVAEKSLSLPRPHRQSQARL